MKQSKEGSVIVLEPQKLLCGVEKVVLLHLLWISHFHHAPLMIFVIRKLLWLVHDGYLWLEEPIPIMVELIHRISQFPCKGKYPAKIAGKSKDLALTHEIFFAYFPSELYEWITMLVDS